MQKPNNINEFVTNCYNSERMVNAFMPSHRRSYSNQVPTQYQPTPSPNTQCESSSVDQFISPTSYQNTIVTTDVEICVGMSNCHLTKNNSDGMNGGLLANDYSILQHFHPLNLSTVMPTPSNGYQNTYHLNKEQIQEVCYLNRFKYIELNQCSQESAIDENSENVYQRSSCNKFLTNIFKSNNYEMNFMENTSSHASCNQKITTSIKYQDKNGKLDFKARFLEANKKFNGCFHDATSNDYLAARSSINNSPESLMPSETMGSDVTAETVAPPKKKWIRHYLKGDYLYNFNYIRNLFTEILYLHLKLFENNLFLLLHGFFSFETIKTYSNSL
jgi:hypothetical protein